MERVNKCSGCGKILDKENSGNSIFYTGQGSYCFACAAKLPNYIMKKCCQCKFYDVDGLGNPFCKSGWVRYISDSDDACDKYRPK